MVWGLDGVVGGVKGLFSGKSAPQAFQEHNEKSPLDTRTRTLPTPDSPQIVSRRLEHQDTTATSITASGPSGAVDGSSSSGSGGGGDDYWTNARSRKQLTVFLAGATFVLFSTRIASRALRRKYLQNRPAFYWPSNAPPALAVNGAVEALEALTVASAGVFSASIMLGGGLLWAFDISSLADLRRRIRGGLGVDGSGRSELQVEQDFEEWIAATLDRKRRKDEEATTTTGGSGQRAQAQGIADLDEIRQQWRNERGKER